MNPNLITWLDRASERMKNHRCDRTDTGVCPYRKGMEIRQVGANPRVRPVFPFVGSMKNPKIKTFRRLYGSRPPEKT